MNGPYDKGINFGGDMNDFGRSVLREVIMTDYGPGSTFDSISGHPLENHHGGLHDQVNIWKGSVDGTGLPFRFHK